MNQKAVRSERRRCAEAESRARVAEENMQQYENKAETAAASALAIAREEAGVRMKELELQCMELRCFYFFRVQPSETLLEICWAYVQLDGTHRRSHDKGLVVIRQLERELLRERHYLYLWLLSLTLSTGSGRITSLLQKLNIYRLRFWCCGFCTLTTTM